MGAAVALTATFDSDIIASICSFLDDSSLVPTYATDASDVGNIADISEFKGTNGKYTMEYRRNIFI